MITFNPFLAQEAGINEAIVYGVLQFLEESEDVRQNDFFLASNEKLHLLTTLSPHYIRKALRTLEELDMIETKRIGVPPERYAKVIKDRFRKGNRSNE